MSNNINEIAAVKADKLTGNSATTKTLSLIITEDPTVKSKCRTYLAERVNMGSFGIEFSGYEIITERLKQLKDVKTFNDAIELAKTDNTERESLQIPSGRIIRIKVVNYTVNK